ncbi:hypothetical protein F1880_001986 [Penicillium rolfsii]|nr:hypothetical protein F1880_001986 [Penicillium rolfsii]
MQKWNPKSKEKVSDHAREISFPGKEASHVRSTDRGQIPPPIGAQPTARKSFDSAARFSRSQIDNGASELQLHRFRWAKTGLSCSGPTSPLQRLR